MGILTLVMAGGAGERLRPLTDQRAKPAVLFGGFYRVIDFTLSNCINSGLRRVFVLTQYKSYSLSNHLRTTYGFLSHRVGEFIDEVPAQMQLGSDWYKGTADAVRQNLGLVEQYSPRHVLVLSGDHVYKMDYRLMHGSHLEHGGQVTLAVCRVDIEEARSTYGVVRVDEQGSIVEFVEKSPDPPVIPGTRQCLASMGIYLFDVQTLNEWLSMGGDDFGHDVLPRMLAQGKKIHAYDFSASNRIQEFEIVLREGRRHKRLVERAADSDYWRDVGTLESYWSANLDLVSAAPRFNLYGEKWPLFCSPQHYPPAKFVHEAPGLSGQAFDSIVCDGVILAGGLVHGSVLSPGIFVHNQALIESSVLLGGSLDGGVVNETSIGRNCRIRNAIIDDGVSLRDGTTIGYDRSQDEARGLKVQPLPGGADYLVAVPHGFST
jgi:glucose-1-phosphate adenylyltransferase